MAWVGYRECVLRDGKRIGIAVSSVSIVTRLQPGRSENRDSIPGRVKIFLLYTAVQASYVSQPASSPMNTVGYFHRIKRRSVMLTTQWHLVPTEEIVDRVRR